MSKVVIIYGDPVEGFSYLGPFESIEAADYYVDCTPMVRDGHWWTAELEDPLTRYRQWEKPIQDYVLEEEEDV